MVKTAETYHVPVLLCESVNGLDINPNGIYVDITFGGGGHSKEILSHLSKEGHLYSFDQDADAEQNIYKLNSDGKKPENFTFVRSNFRYLANWLRYYGELRGFSFRFNAPLDMRMNKRAQKTAADILQEYDVQELANIFYLYGELKNSYKIATAIVNSRGKAPILTTNDIQAVVEPLFKREREKKEMAKLFQALRIEVNQEMIALKEMLNSASEVLKPGGRIAIITYHSLEDRIVKNVMKSGNIEGKVEKDFFGHITAPFKLINNKVIVPSNDEQERNPRSRSAKLRIAEKR